MRKSALKRFPNQPKSTQVTAHLTYLREKWEKNTRRGLILSGEDWLEGWKLRGLTSAQNQSHRASWWNFTISFFFWNNLWIICRSVHANKANFWVTLTLNLIIWRHGLKKWLVLPACILEKFGMCKMQESMTQENLRARIEHDSGLKTRGRSGRHKSIYIGLCFV